MMNRQEKLVEILLGSIVTEKSYLVAEAGEGKQILFKVRTDATKCEIREAVEQLFEVKVDHVRTVNVKGKTRKFKQKQGRTQDWKKAYVKLQPGQDINFFVEN